jgi:hypothetical protein
LGKKLYCLFLDILIFSFTVDALINSNNQNDIVGRLYSLNSNSNNHFVLFNDFGNRDNTPLCLSEFFPNEDIP